jgi:hypothetical protein
VLLTIGLVAAILTFASAAHAAPANDAFSAATTLPAGLPNSDAGSNVDATKELGEPNHAGDPGGHSVWYSWTPSSSGRVGVRNSCSGLDALIAVYTGTGVGALAPVASNEDVLGLSCFFASPEFEFDASAGTTYRIAIDGKDGAQGSFNLQLNPPPSNDDFAAATSVGGSLPQSVFGSTKVADKEPGEPNHAGDPGGHSVWYSWTPSSSGPVDISTCSSFFGGSFDTALAVYTGSSLGSLTPVASNDDGSGQNAFPQCSFADSEVEFAATAATTYRIAVDGASGSTGNFTLRLDGRPANDGFDTPQVLSPSIPTNTTTVTNKFATKQGGEPDHAGDPGGASVWYSWTPASSGEVAISTCSFDEDFEALLGVYTGSAVNALVPVASSSEPVTGPCGSYGVEVRFSAVAGTDYKIAVDGKGGAESRFSLTIEGPPANDAFAAAQPLGPGLPTGMAGTTKRASKEAGEPDHDGDPGGHSVWYSWTPSSSGPVDVSICPYNENGTRFTLAVYTGSSVNGLTPVLSEESLPTGCGSGAATEEFAASVGTTYRIAIDGKGGGEGIFSFEIRGLQANDDFADAQVISPEPLFVPGSNRFASKEAGEPNHAGNPGGHSLWYSWTPSASGPVQIEGCDSSGSLDTLLAVYTGSAMNALTPVAANDDASGEQSNEICKSSNRSEVVFEALASTTYRIAVDGKNGQEGKFVLIFKRGGEATNDDFGSATSLTSPLPLFANGDTKVGSKESGEPNHAGDPGGHSLWYSWTAQKSGPIAISACARGSLDTLLAVYTGSALDALTPVAANDDAAEGACSATDSEVRFSAVAGTTYMIAVDGKGASTGAFELQGVGVEPNDAFGKPYAIGSRLPGWSQSSNRFATKQAGEPDHAGGAGGASVWFKWTAPRTAAVSVDTCGSSFDTLLGVYTGPTVDELDPVGANDDGGGLCGTRSRLTFDAVANTVYKIAVDGKGGAEGAVELRLDMRPRGDDFSDARTIPGWMTLYDQGSTRLATKEAGEPDHAGDSGGHSVWYSWTPFDSGKEVLSSCAGDFQPLLAVYTGSAVDALVPVPAEPVATSDCAAGSSLVLNAVAGTTYRIAMDGVGGDSGHFDLSIEPFFAEQPETGSEQPLSVTAGQSNLGPTAVPPPARRPKPLKCKRGFVRKVVHGKPKCVKKKRHPHRHRRRAA